MILVLSLFTLLISSSIEAQRIKGGFGKLSQPRIFGKGGGAGAVHHAAVVQDPLSGAPVVVEKILPAGGIKSAGLGAGAAQVAIAEDPFGQRQFYRTGLSQIPYGLSGSDYYSYPASLLSATRPLRRKAVISPNLSGLRPAGFSAGDSQIKTNVFGLRRPVYRSGLSSVPYGLSGMDYNSYPASLLNTPRTYGKNAIASPNLSGLRPIGFSAGDSQIKTSAFGLGRPSYRSGFSSVPYGLSGMDYYSYPASLLTAPRTYGKNAIVSPNLSGLRPVGFSAGDSQIKTSAFGLGRPTYRSGYSAVPYGLSGLDYYSYPTSLMTSPRALRQKSIVSPNVYGLRPIGFSAGDAQIKTSAFGLRRPAYRSGASTIPYGLMGSDYYSYPSLNQLLSQRRLADDLGLGQTSIVTGASDFPVQSLVDPLGSGQTQMSIDDGLGSGIAQVRERLVQEPTTGEITKVTEVTKGGSSLDGLVQQNVADAIVQENLSSGLSGYNFSPRVSFLSQYPFDAPDLGLLRSVVTNPVVQQQQEIEQILV